MADSEPPRSDDRRAHRLEQLAEELERALGDARAAIRSGDLDARLREELTRSLAAAASLQREAESLLRLLDPEND